MGAQDIERKTNSLVGRKEADFPDVVASGRQKSLTMKYAAQPRGGGQPLVTR